MKRHLLTLVLISCFLGAFSQPDSLNRKRLAWFTGGMITGYAGTMTGLSTIWYKGYEKSSFHFFDDSREWLQMDKCGHSFSAFYLTKIVYKGFRWSGMAPGKAILWSGISGFIGMGSIDLLDGFSAKWGASVSDIAANTLGIATFTIQEALWREQRIQMKLSFHRSGLSHYYPAALGSGMPEEIIKDYNGQTYWLSFNLKSLTRINNLPPWLNLALGYSGENMIGGLSNEGFVTPEPLYRYRQFYISLDADLSKIPVKNKTLGSILKALNVLKVPFPALEISQSQFHGRWLYF